MSKVALVVGAGQSLGAYLSEGLAADGYQVALADINKETVEKTAFTLAEQYGAKTILPITANAVDENDVSRMVKTVTAAFGRIDLLVYNAGVAKAARIDEFSIENWGKSIDVNLTGYFICAREVAKVMMKQRSGRIIQINSKSGKVGSKHNSAYSAAKFGGVGLTQSLALDLAEFGITVNSLMLGNLLKSPMFQSLLPQYAKKLNIPEDMVEQTYIDKVPLKRGCEYSDVLNLLKFYASDAANYCTGQSINITGGQVMF